MKRRSCLAALLAAAAAIPAPARAACEARFQDLTRIGFVQAYDAFAAEGSPTQIDFEVVQTGDQPCAFAVGADRGQSGGNVPYARFNGATLAYGGMWAGWTVRGSLDHVKPVNEVTGQPLTRRPKNSLKLGAEGTWHDATYGATFIANGTRWDQKFDSNFNATPVRLPGYATLDVHASWRVVPEWTVQANLNNVANRRYETALGYNQPGREFYVTLRWAPR